MMQIDFDCFSNFQTDEKFKEHEKSQRNDHHAELKKPQKFKTFLNKEIAETKNICENILTHSLLNKSLQTTFIVPYDFETMIAETDNQNWEN